MLRSPRGLAFTSSLRSTNTQTCSTKVPIVTSGKGLELKSHVTILELLLLLLVWASVLVSVIDTRKHFTYLCSSEASWSLDASLSYPLLSNKIQEDDTLNVLGAAASPAGLPHKV